MLISLSSPKPDGKLLEGKSHVCFSATMSPAPGTEPGTRQESVSVCGKDEWILLLPPRATAQADEGTFSQEAREGAIPRYSREVAE